MDTFRLSPLPRYPNHDRLEQLCTDLLAAIETSASRLEHRIERAETTLLTGFHS